MEEILKNVCNKCSQEKDYDKNIDDFKEYYEKNKKS